MTDSFSDLRREPRHPADGRIVIRRPQEDTGDIEGRLVDISETGFRIVHDGVTFQPGQVVEFHREGASGKARVVWNRIFHKQVETGFLVTD
jgi:hypothetical protein